MAVVSLLVLTGSCRDATQITFELSTDAPCTKLASTGITLGSTNDVDGDRFTTETRQCTAAAGDGGRARIGSIVAVPSGDSDERIALRVVVGLGKTPADCVRDGFKPTSADETGCIVARRVLRFIPHQNLRVPVNLDLDCLGVACSAGTTCSRGSCVSAACDGENCTIASDAGSVDVNDEVDSASDVGADATDAITEPTCLASDPDIGLACSVPGALGECAAGTWQCTGGQKSCESTVTPAPTEICNGLDDTCDGNVDEGCACTDGATQSCYTGPSGTDSYPPCHVGSQTCSNGQWGSCTGEATPGTETCNGVDDDCNGTPDDNVAEVGQSCSTGFKGSCAAGVRACQSGTLLCQQTTTACSASTTSGPTNGSWDCDCDGVTEYDYPGAESWSSCSLSTSNLNAFCGQFPSNQTQPCSQVHFFGCPPTACGGTIVEVPCGVWLGSCAYLGGYGTATHDQGCR